MSEEMKPKKAWLREYSKEGTKEKHSQNFDNFIEWAHTNDIELVNEYKTSDPREFSKKWGKRILQYYNKLLEKGYKPNTARSKIIAPRAFFKSQCIEVKIKRGSIAKAQLAIGEHEFLLEELAKMYRIGDIEDKARLSTAISLGWGAQDFVRLKWSFIEPYLTENLEAPVGFWHTREKTGAPSRSHLTHESIESLRAWKSIAPKSEYIFMGYNGTHLTEDALSRWLKALAKKAKIEARGRIRFHLLRKFLMSQLSSSGMNQWETKLCIGKSVPSDILTYLRDQSQNLREKYMNAEERFTLTGLTNANHSKIEVMSEKLETHESIISKQETTIREQDVKIEALTKGQAKSNTRQAKLEQENKELKALVKKLVKLWSKAKG